MPSSVRIGPLGLLAIVLVAVSLAHGAECPILDYGGTVTFGSPSIDVVCAITADSDGSRVLTGGFSGTVDFDPGEGVDEHVSQGGTDFFVTKFGPDGSYAWTRTFGGIISDLGQGITVSDEGNIIVTGQFHDTVDFDPGPGTDTYTSNGSTDAFVTLFNADGSYGWTRVVGGEESDAAVSIASGVGRSFLVIGGFGEVVDFDPSQDGEEIHESTGNVDVFILKLTDEGEFVWAVTFGGEMYDTGRDVSVDADGSVYATGGFLETVDFDPSDEGVDERTSSGSFDIFLTKLTPDGAQDWTVTMGGTGADESLALTLDPTGTILFAGYFSPSDDGAIDFDPTEGVDEHESHGAYDAFVSKLGTDGSYHWTWTGGGTGNEFGRAVTGDATGNVFLAGAFGTLDDPPGYVADFDPAGEGDVHISNGSEDVFITHLLVDGSYGWTETFGGLYGDTAEGAALGASGEIVLAGQFTDVVDFDPTDGVDTHTSNGSLDVFVTTFECLDDLPCDGDANGDGLVDPLDSGFVLARFGCDVDSGDPDCDTADMNGDALVDPLDVGFILARFGTCP